jgi:hypothetical protein
MGPNPSAKGTFDPKFSVGAHWWNFVSAAPATSYVAGMGLLKTVMTVNCLRHEYCCSVRKKAP